MRTIKTKAGFTLIEVLIAAIILVMAGVSAILVERQAIQSSSYNKHRLQAIGLAQEGISGVNGIFSSELYNDEVDIWDRLGRDTPGEDVSYKLDLPSQQIIVGEDPITQNNTDFTRKIYVITPEPAVPAP